MLPAVVLEVEYYEDEDYVEDRGARREFTTRRPCAAFFCTTSGARDDPGPEPGLSPFPLVPRWSGCHAISMVGPAETWLACTLKDLKLKTAASGAYFNLFRPDEINFMRGSPAIMKFVAAHTGLFDCTQFVTRSA